MVLWTTMEQEEGAFFRVLHESTRSQTAVMTIAPGEEAGEPEVHAREDQVIVVMKGVMLARVWDDGEDATPREVRGGAGSLLVVDAGLKHWVKSVGEEPLVFFTVYGPPAY